jgi:hypothetical protein
MKDAFAIHLALAHPEPRSALDEIRLRGSADLALVMSTICEWLAQRGVILFEVSGFGQLKWPVDVGVDLAVVAEQIPDVLEGLACRRAVDLDFYEQGIQRLVSFEPADHDELSVSCRSGTAWAPTPDEYLASRRDVIETFVTFGKTFADVANARCPGPVSHETFQAWLWRFTGVVALLER